MKIILSGNPLSTQTLYKFTCRGRFPHMYMSDRGKELKEQYQLEAKTQYRGEIITEEIEHLIVTYFFKFKRKKRDADNFAKIVLDALEGIIYENDCLIRDLTNRKRISKEDPRIEIEI